ncbi:MAG: hypothetical protein B6U94_02740 [Thermofilum sp. ex4484_79]|nr:MAG: hypothetical protein B6U94_02740 [Thermofilum sp. ex4484_79]
MPIRYQHTTWNEEVLTHGEVRVLFSGRGWIDKGEDVIELFSYPVDPHYLAVKGEKISGIFCELSDVCIFKIVLKDPTIEKLKFRVSFRGKIKKNVMDIERKVYRCRMRWEGKHLHVITFPAKYQIVNVSPKGYKLSRGRNGVTLSWLWKKGFSGEVIVKMK